METNYNIYEYEKMKAVKELHPDWIWNRADTHIILGVPGSLEAFKTPVEPGNSFSPGPGTYGVSTWIYTEGQLHAPEEKPLEELLWSFEEGYLPVIHSQWSAGNIAVKSSLFTAGNLETSNLSDYLSVELENKADHELEVIFYLAVRSFGSAGGPIKSLAYKDNTVHINGAPLIYPEEPATGFGALNYNETKKDISVYLRKGNLPKTVSVEEDSSTWASGALEYRLKLLPGQKMRYDFAFHMHAGHWMLNWMPPIQRPLQIDRLKTTHLENWKKLLRIKLDLPDKRFADALNCQLTHLYMFTVANSIRITPISYPIWWLRDGAYILNALNRGGLHEFCERACKEVADKDAFGGFGSEGDGPSDGIWILSEHYLLTRDKEFLKDIYPHIKRKADLLIKMRKTEVPIKIFTEFSIPKCMLEPNNDILCTASKDGIIYGRMDHHYPVFFINGFAYLALKRAAICTRELGLDDSLYEQEAQALKEALYKKAKDTFGEDERDYNSAFWPAGWTSKDDKFIESKFKEFWDTIRCPGGNHQPEQLWSYFEAGQAHNYLLMGQREKAWISIDWFLKNHTAPGLYTYPEAIDGNTSLLWPRTRGWDDVNYVTPHGWTAAEVFHLLRECLVREEEDTLILGTGVPEGWMSESFKVENLPTHFGNLSYQYDPATMELEVRVIGLPANKIKLEFPIPVKLKLNSDSIND